LRGIVSKRKNSRYRSGRSPDWIKSKNPDAPVVSGKPKMSWIDDRPKIAPLDDPTTAQL
jgi:hypothetical protein